MTSAQQAIQLTRDFAAHEPTNQMFQRDMAVRLEMLAKVYAAMGNTELALDTQNESRSFSHRFTLLLRHQHHWMLCT